MDSASLVSLTAGILTFIVGIGSLLVSRRKVKSESRNLDADAISKFQESLSKQQERNDALYQENVELQVKVSEITRSNEQMRIRLEERDAQLTSTSKQLDLLRELARTTPVTDTLKTQLDTMNHIVDNMQTAQSEMQQLLKDREKAYRELFDSTRGITKVKPA